MDRSKVSAVTEILFGIAVGASSVDGIYKKFEIFPSFLFIAGAGIAISAFLSIFLPNKTTERIGLKNHQLPYWLIAVMILYSTMVFVNIAPIF